MTNNIVPITDAGLSSLSGFSYQIKVFIFQLAQLKEGQRVEFETLDDVAVSSIPNNDGISDFCFKWSVDETLSTNLFQVKQTNVTEAVGRQVLYNWLLAYNQRQKIENFTLYIAHGYSMKAKAFSNGAEKEYQSILKSNKQTSALVTRVKEIYQGHPDKFKHDYDVICSKSNIQILDEIDHLIAAQLQTTFRAAALNIGKTYFGKRVEELFNKISARIMDCASRRIPYVCVFAEYMQLCEEICQNISPMRFAPDYESFRQVHTQLGLTDPIINSREYRQLCHCNISGAEMLEHLRWELYYQSIRQHYLTEAKKEIIANTERIAQQNHRDVVLELKAESKDTPLLRLIKTKRQDISTLTDEFSKWGTYIFLTQDNLPNQISWKDEEGEIDEK